MARTSIVDGVKNDTLRALTMKGNIVPDVDNSRWLGLYNFRFERAYAVNLYFSRVGNAVIPTSDDAYDLGSTSLEFQDSYIDGIAFMDALALDNVITKTGAYTVTINDSVILVDSSGGAFTLTLPAASTATGQILIIKKTEAAANAVTIDGDGAETIDGAATNAEIDAQYDMLILICDGTEWHIIGRWIH